MPRHTAERSAPAVRRARAAVGLLVAGCLAVTGAAGGPPPDRTATTTAVSPETGAAAGGGAVAAAVPAPAVAGGAPAAPGGYAVVALDQQAVAVLADGTRAGVPADALAVYLPGTRVPDPVAARLATTLGSTPATDRAATPGAARRAGAAQEAWLAAGTVPGTGGPYEDMARAALLDLHALDLGDGAVVAGWSAMWRYVWPRDAAFVAVALARTGHVEDALEVLGFLARVQEDDGSFQARYLPDASGPPDDRGTQTDGTGWSMWAAGLVLEQVPAAERAPVAAALAPQVRASLAHATALLGADGLPPASPDYWEVPEDELTLGTAAPLVAGLEQAATVLAAAGDADGADAATTLAATSRSAVEATFAPVGWTRHADGAALDAASTFALPPFWSAPGDGAAAAWQASVPAMLRPTGGLAPGAGWRQDGVTWTPQTALYAWVAAEQGDAAQARRWLDVLDAHRTPSGSIPEKILADGSPAAVAPLGWSAACALLALDALEP
ncbi:glycoside hydrolase family 15 [Cellulomonas sp. SLBN-39]|uniref:glycoside hydrolase family 15 n=1 Tax=Cellulomonas sp. SLBN-39 TaxID=2768446 RepID=UPI001150850C|nr:glycoside hydrolase family 15 [Cellulomonas sp. SLBN-39]TQL01653.1 hypothetical protein FBY24_0708 [Cellulomonas sp. SLBN-39]